MVDLSMRPVICGHAAARRASHSLLATMTKIIATHVAPNSHMTRGPAWSNGGGSSNEDKMEAASTKLATMAATAASAHCGGSLVRARTGLPDGRVCLFISAPTSSQHANAD